MTPCKDCVFQVKPKLRAETEARYPKQQRMSQCRYKAPKLVHVAEGEYAGACETDWPWLPDDDPGCGDGEPKDTATLVEGMAIRRAEKLEDAIRKHKHLGERNMGKTLADEELYGVLDD